MKTIKDKIIKFLCVAAISLNETYERQFVVLICFRYFKTFNFLILLFQSICTSVEQQKIVVQPGAVMDGRLLVMGITGAAGSVAGRRVRRDDRVESSRQEVRDVAHLPRRTLFTNGRQLAILMVQQQ